MKKVKDMTNKWAPTLEELSPRICHFIENCKNVKGDGHCGYRSVAYLRNYDNGDPQAEGWKIVRRELLEEMFAHEAEYKSYSGEERFDFLKKNLECTIVPIWNRNYWFDLPDMAVLAANAYNCIFVCLTPGYNSQTYLPWRTHPIAEDVQIMVVAHIDNFSHFVPVQLHHMAPLPPIEASWKHCRYDVAKHWNNIVEERVDQWRRAIARPLIAALKDFYQLCMTVYGHYD